MPKQFYLEVTVDQPTAGIRQALRHAGVPVREITTVCAVNDGYIFTNTTLSQIWDALTGRQGCTCNLSSKPSPHVGFFELPLTLQRHFTQRFVDALEQYRIEEFEPSKWLDPDLFQDIELQCTP